MLETKKLEIAHALANDPSVLFLDEVMAGLNVDETTEVIRLVQGVAREKNIGVGVVEHVMSVIRDLTHRVIVLEAGEIIAAGPYEEVAKNPRVIAAYLGGAAVMLQVRNLECGYGRIPVLRKVDLTVGNESVGLFGPNGACAGHRPEHHLAGEDRPVVRGQD